MAADISLFQGLQFDKIIVFCVHVFICTYVSSLYSVDVVSGWRHKHVHLLYWE